MRAGGLRAIVARVRTRSHPPAQMRRLPVGSRPRRRTLGAAIGLVIAVAVLVMCISAVGATGARSTLTVVIFGPGSVVVGTPHTTCTTHCSLTEASGAQVTLSAHPVGAARFVGWSGACSGTTSCRVTMGAALRVTAGFRPTFRLSVTVTGTGAGRISSVPAGISCRTHCSARFVTGTQVALNATAAAGSAFAGFSGSCKGMTCAPVMSRDRAVGVRFAANPVAPVTGVTLTGRTRTSIDLFWSNPPGVTVTRIIVRRAKGARAPARTTAGTGVPTRGSRPIGVTDTRLTPGTRYSYAIFVRDRFGHTSPVARITARTDAISARRLGPPVLSLTPGPGQLTLNGFAAVAHASGYSYRRCDRAGATCGAATPVSRAGTTISGLVDGVSYTVKLVAIGNGTVWADSAAAAKRAAPAATPLVPPSSTNTGCAAATIVQENAKAGGTGWQPPATITAPLVQGFAQYTSVACGGIVGLYLGTQSTTPVPVQVEVWRLGDYQGSGGRLVWTSPTLHVSAPATWEHVDPTTYEVTAPWQETATLTVPHNWTQGIYELRIVPVGNPSAAGSIPLVIRDDTRTTPMVQVLATNTDQMYDTWGGNSAYSTATGISTVVSLNRPYDGFGMAQILSEDVPLARYAESQGRNVSYLTDGDLNSGRPEIGAATAIVVGSHSEYWTPNMRANFEAALARGANAAFFGANNIYWHPVPSPTTGPYRTLNIWKLNHNDPNAASPTLASTMWRLSPISKPEQMILGEQFGCSNVLMPLTVPTSLGWVFANSGATPGQQLQGVLYQETDAPSAGAPMPAGTRLAAAATFPCPQRGAGYVSGSAIALAPQPGGGLVVSVGTRGWVCLLDGSCVTNPVYSSPALLAIDPDIVTTTVRNDPAAESVIRRATANILGALLSGPAAGYANDPSYPLAPGA